MAFFCCSRDTFVPDVSDMPEPSLIVDGTQDDAIARALGEQLSPADFSVMALKMAVIMKRRVEAFRATKLLSSRSRTGLPADALKKSQLRLEASEVPGDEGEVVQPKRISRKSVRAGQSLLDQRLHFANLGQEIMKGDGNCQFRSLSYQMYGTQEKYPFVRARVCEHMDSCRDAFAIYFEEGEFEQYLSRMRADRTWGDELTLRAAADCFACTIHVVTDQVDNWHLRYIPEGQPPRKRLFLTYISPVHYNSINR